MDPVFLEWAIRSTRRGASHCANRIRSPLGVDTETQGRCILLTPGSRRSPTRAIAPLGLLVVAAMAPAQASAQTLSGRVAIQPGDAPLAGALVTLRDSTGTVHGQGLSGSSGEFRVAVEAPGPYRVGISAIGYSEMQPTWVRLGPGERISRALAVRLAPIDVTAIDVKVGRRCGRSVRDGGRTARLWDEARKALEHARWTEESGALKFQVRQFERTVIAADATVRSEQSRARTGWFAESPYRSLPPAELSRDGYIRENADGSLSYFAPDPTVLLSDEFLADHCFGLVGPSTANPESVGLSFEPVPGRGKPDIRGAIWIHEPTARLRRLEFSYVNVPISGAEGWDQVGGSVDFTEVGAGKWIVRAWAVRMPLEARPVGGFGNSRREVELVTLEEHGALVLKVTDSEGRELLSSDAGAVQGMVVGPTGQALAAATVEMVGTGHAVETDAAGRFSLSNLLPGTYELRVQHSELTLSGLGEIRRDITIAPADTRPVRIDPSDSDAAAREICAPELGGAAPVVLFGALGRPQESVDPVVLRIWTPAGESLVAPEDVGSYRLCLRREDLPLRVAAVESRSVAASPDALNTVTISESAGSFVRADLTVDPGEGVGIAGLSYSAGESTFIGGTVQDRGTEHPIEGAAVSAADSAGTIVARTITSADGTFRLRGAALQSAEILSVEMLGYGTGRFQIELTEGQGVIADVGLAAEALELDPIIVTETRRAWLVGMGFYDRRDHGGALFVDRDEIERRRPSRVTDLLRGRSHLDVIRWQGKEDVRVFGLGTRMRGSDCQPAVWVDGALVRSSGEPDYIRTTTGMKIYTDAFLTDLVDPEVIEAIEVYDGPAMLPARYGGSNADCGVILIWTRR